MVPSKLINKEDIIISNELMNYGESILYKGILCSHYNIPIVEKQFSEECESYFDNEYNTVTSLDHKNIIKPIGITNNRSIIYPLYDGDVKDLMSNGKLDDSIIKQLVEQILPAIIYMNMNGVYHNDLHLGNILYRKLNEEEYLFVITDFESSEYKEYVIPRLDVYYFLQYVFYIIDNETGITYAYHMSIIDIIDIESQQRIRKWIEKTIQYTSSINLDMGDLIGRILVIDGIPISFNEILKHPFFQ